MFMFNKANLKHDSCRAVRIPFIYHSILNLKHSPIFQVIATVTSSVIMHFRKKEKRMRRGRKKTTAVDLFQHLEN